MRGYVCLKDETFILNWDVTIILPIIRAKSTIENVAWIFLKTADK